MLPVKEQRRRPTLEEGTTEGSEEGTLSFKAKTVGTRPEAGPSRLSVGPSQVHVGRSLVLGDEGACLPFSCEALFFRVCRATAEGCCGASLGGIVGTGTLDGALRRRCLALQATASGSARSLGRPPASGLKGLVFSVGAINTQELRELTSQVRIW